MCTTLKPTKPLCLGTWQAYDHGNSDPRSFQQLIEYAISLDIKFFDTAESYGNGEAEKLIGRAVKNKREQVVIASKFSHHHSRPDLVEKSLNKSLKRLNTDYIDIYFQHWPPKTGPRMQTFEKLLDLKESGKIRAIGVSNWGLKEFEQCQIASQIDYIQIAYNFIWRHELEDIAEIVNNNDIKVVSYSPLCQGFLTKKLQISYGDNRDANVFSQNQEDTVLSSAKSYFNDLADKYKEPVATIVLAWVIKNPLIYAPIVGVRTKEQLEQLIEATKLDLDFEETFELESLRKYKSLWDWRP